MRETSATPGHSVARCGLRQARPLGAVDDQAVDGVDELVEAAVPERRQPAPAQEHRQVGQEQRRDHARRRLRAVSAQLQPDRLHRDLAVLADRVAVDLDVRLEPIVSVGLGHEDDRPRRVPLGETGQHVLGRLDPLLRNPGEVRHHTRSLHRLARLGHPLRTELALDLGDRA